jgi:hypothetical protein
MEKNMNYKQNNPYIKSPAYTWYVLGGLSASYTHFVVKGMNPFRHNAPKHFRFNNKQDAYNFMVKENKKVIADWSTMN